MKRLNPFQFVDHYTLLLVGVVILASVLPAQGGFAGFMKGLTTVAVSLLFFLHGIKLPRAALLSGLTHWRLHLLIFSCTFVLFPLLAIIFRPVLIPLLSEPLYLGIVYLCVLPATVQSAISMVSIAKGNVAAAICSASGSTLLGVLITPFMVGWLIHDTSEVSGTLGMAGRIFVQLMLPFLVGHLLHPYAQKWLKKFGRVIPLVDRGSILLIVYTAFSAAIVQGLWSQVTWSVLGALLLVCAVALGVVLLVSWKLACMLGFDRADQITVMFCGSQKSLASGIPMAQILFTASTVGFMVLPLMLFHQMQLMLCSMLAQHWSRRMEAANEAIAATVTTKS